MNILIIRLLRAALVLTILGTPLEASEAPADAPGSTSDQGASDARPPAARTVDVIDTQFGTRVPDPYRWMEGADNAELAGWMKAQGAFTNAYLTRLPGRDALLKRISELGLSYGYSSGVQLADGRIFHYELAPAEQLPKLMVRDRDGTERVLLDPAQRAIKDTHASINNFTPSPDGSVVAVLIAPGGSEVSEIHVLDVATGREHADVIEHVWGEFAPSWQDDGKAFYYTQMATAAAAADPMLNMQVRLHRIGTPPAGDPTILAGQRSRTFAFAPEEFPSVYVTADSPWILALGGGARSEARIALANVADVDTSGGGATAWKIIAGYEDGIEYAYVHGDRVYMLSHKDASGRRVISVPVDTPALAHARVEIPEDPSAPLVNIAVASDALYAVRMVQGHAAILRLPWDSGSITSLALPFSGWTDELGTSRSSDGVVFDLEGWTQPIAFHAYDPKSQELSTVLQPKFDGDYAGIVVDEVEATSADGTKVPLSILRRKDGVLDGSHPTILYGYGGYGISQSPTFSATRLAWLERGGVWAIAHVRGGGEKGYAWQVNGTGPHKMNGINDFIACADYLIAKKYTSRERLAANGGSMGGVLVGRAITVRPELFAAAQIAVGIVNPLRILAAENGANQKAELGDPETEAGFRAILDMDPYQHIQPATAYPAVLFTIGLNDGRVAPWMTAKAAARLQATSTSGKPVLIRLDADAGHGIGTTRSQAYAERADGWSFLLAAMGDPAFQPAAD